MASVPKFSKAEAAFDYFCAANEMQTIISSFNRMCDILNINPAQDSTIFYRKLRKKLSHFWKAHSLFCKLDKRVLQKEYKKQLAAYKYKILVLGAGPAGLRFAIEMALLGAKVVVVEKRTSFSRNNVLHLWPFIIHDLNALGAKKFFGKFCAGDINHISIQTLQCILLKICLVFGVQVYPGADFCEIVEPQRLPNDESKGWRIRLSNDHHVLNNYEFDVLIGANGKQCALEGFKRKEFRGRLAIAITANFVNNNTEAEVRVKEISGVAYIFNQKFFKDLYAATKIDLENIVYYKNETHYFVMTAKKSSLLLKGVIKNDYEKPQDLLHPSNINHDALKAYACEAANFSTNNELPNLQYATNSRGEADIALFDFTSLFQAEHSTRIVQRCGRQLVIGLVGDSLLEPFWPTGSGCARAFLAAMDTAWMIKRLGDDNCHILNALAERESIYQRLSQTTPQNMVKSFTKYTIDPATRYPTLNLTYFKPDQIGHLVDSDDPSFVYSPLASPPTPSKLRKNSRKSVTNFSLSVFSPSSIESGQNSLMDLQEYQLPGECQLLKFFQIKLDTYSDIGVDISDLFHSWHSGLAFLCVIYTFRPHLVDLNRLSQNSQYENVEKAIRLFKQEFAIDIPCSAVELISNEEKMLSYLHQIHSCLKYENHNKENQPPNHLTQTDYSNKRRFSKENQPSKQMQTGHSNKRQSSKGHHFNLFQKEISYNFKKNSEVINKEVPAVTTLAEKKEKRKEKAHSKVELTNVRLISDRITDLHQKLFGIEGPENNSKSDSNDGNNLVRFLLDRGKDLCALCGGRLIYDESNTAAGYVFHSECFRCAQCDIRLSRSNFALFVDDTGKDLFFCSNHYKEKMKNKDQAPTQSNDENGLDHEKDVNKSIPTRRMSSIQRRPAFHNSSSSGGDAVVEDRLRSVSAPVRNETTGERNSFVSHDEYISSAQSSIASSQSINEISKRRPSWDEVVAQCRAQRSYSNDSSNSCDTQDDSQFSPASNIPSLQPRTIFLNEESGTKQDMPDLEMTDSPPQTSPQIIEIGGGDSSISRLSDITECPSIFERSNRDATLPQSTLTSITESPISTIGQNNDTMKTDTSGTLRTDRNDSLLTEDQSYDVEKGRKKIKPLIPFDSLAREIREFESRAGGVLDDSIVRDSENSFVNRPLEKSHRFTSLSSEMLSQFDPAYDEDSDQSATLSYNKDATFMNPRHSTDDPIRSAISTPDLSSISSTTSSQKKPKKSNISSSSHLKKKIPADSPGKPKGLLKGLFRRNKKKSEVNSDYQISSATSQTMPDSNNSIRSSDIIRRMKSSSQKGNMKRYKSETNIADSSQIYSADSSLNLTISPLSSRGSCASSCNDLTTEQINDLYDFNPETEQGQKNLELFRLRQAQEIQRQLQEVEVHLADLELINGDLQNRMRKVEYLRQQKISHQSNPDLEDINQMERAIYNEIIVTVAEKNQLINFENDLTMEAKQLELEDRQNRLEIEYRRRMAVPDNKKTDLIRQEDANILQDYLNVVQERNSLVDLQDKQKQRQAVEDARILEALDKRGIHILPTSYVTKIQLGCSQESGLI